MFEVNRIQIISSKAGKQSKLVEVSFLNPAGKVKYKLPPAVMPNEIWKVYIRTLQKGPKVSGIRVDAEYSFKE